MRSGVSRRSPWQIAQPAWLSVLPLLTVRHLVIDILMGRLVTWRDEALREETRSWGSPCPLGAGGDQAGGPPWSCPFSSSREARTVCRDTSVISLPLSHQRKAENPGTGSRQGERLLPFPGAGAAQCGREAGDSHKVNSKGRTCFKQVSLATFNRWGAKG